MIYHNNFLITQEHVRNNSKIILYYSRTYRLYTKFTEEEGMYGEAMNKNEGVKIVGKMRKENATVLPKMVG